MSLAQENNRKYEKDLEMEVFLAFTPFAPLLDPNFPLVCASPIRVLMAMIHEQPWIQSAGGNGGSQKSGVQSVIYNIIARYNTDCDEIKMKPWTCTVYCTILLEFHVAGGWMPDV